jgi:hypothetical protein
MAHDVFISYASGDKVVADAACAALESRGIRCWIAPRDVLPGLHYGEAIIDAIHECRIMVLVFSSKANLSGHIPKEIERAVSQGATIMPLRIEDVFPAKSLDYFIGSVHWLDAITPPLEVHLQTLASNVQTLLARSVSSAAVADVHSASQQRPAKTPNAPSQPEAPTVHVTQNPSKPTASYVVMGILVLVILALGAYILRPRTVSPSSTIELPQTALPQPSPPQATSSSAAKLTANPSTSSVTTPVIASKTSASVSSLKKIAQPPKPAGAAVPTPPANSFSAASSRAAVGPATKLVFHAAPDATVKIVQLLGDQDNERHLPTVNQTISRYGIQGGELGYSFEHAGRAYFLFDDTIGRAAHWPDTIATTDSTNPDTQVPLDFLASAERGRYLHIQPDGLSMGLNSGPVAGISLAGQMYLMIRTKDSGDRATEHSVLTKFVPPSAFQTLRTVSTLPDGHFLKMSLHEQQGSPAGLPPGGPYVFMWGTGTYRESDAYLAIVPVSQFESGISTRYFSGFNDSGMPQWSEKESDAKPIVKDGTLGDLSVTWCKDLNLWLMTYDRRSLPNGIVFSYSATPWGPWSQPQLIFNMLLNGALGKFIHDPHGNPPDSVAGPVLLPRSRDDEQAVRGAAYAPYVVERWTKLRGSELDVYFTMSTLNPYVVVLMKSRLQVE